MKELYAKIMASEDLQKKVMEILAAGSEKGEEATKEALVAFAKEQGYEVTVEEIQEFLEGMQKDGELSEDELDMVAGGKVDAGAVIGSVISLGLACALGSFVGAVRPGDSCKNTFQE